MLCPSSYRTPAKQTRRGLETEWIHSGDKMRGAAVAHGQARARAGRGDEECGNAKTKEKGALLSHARHTKGGGLSRVQRQVLFACTSHGFYTTSTKKRGPSRRGMEGNIRVRSLG